MVLVNSDVVGARDHPGQREGRVRLRGDRHAQPGFGEEPGLLRVDRLGVGVADPVEYPQRGGLRAQHAGRGEGQRSRRGNGGGEVFPGVQAALQLIDVSNVILFEGSIRSDDGHALELRLRNEESIKRVGVVRRQREHGVGIDEPR